MSLYSDYLAERTTDFILETDQGFVTWRYLNDTQVYIVDIYVVPELRQTKVATKLAQHVVEEAKAKGCKEVLGTVIPNTKGCDVSLKALQGFGMSLFGSKDNLVIFKKDI